MSKRSNWCEFSKKEREEIYTRDEHRCVKCYSRSYLGIAHIFVSKAHGGKGCRQNGVLLCQECHNALDNGNNTEKRIEIYNYCCDYLYKEYGDIDKQLLIYNKYS